MEKGARYAMDGQKDCDFHKAELDNGKSKTK